MRISDWSSDVCSSDLAVGLGATLTWYSPDGFYADAQARFSWFSSDLKSTILGRLAKNNDGEGQAFSMELGKRWAAGSKLSITPQVQLTWSDIGFDKSEEHTSELQSLMRISYAVFCLINKKTNQYPAQRQLHIL